MPDILIQPSADDDDDLTNAIVLDDVTLPLEDQSIVALGLLHDTSYKARVLGTAETFSVVSVGATATPDVGAATAEGIAPDVSAGGGSELTADFSDNFSAGSIGEHWTFEAHDASGGSAPPTATVANDGTDYWLELAIPDGTDYDTYEGAIDVPVLWQDATEDPDFEVAFRLRNAPTGTNYTGAGLLISNADESVFVRIDRSYINGQKVFGSRNVGGVASSWINVETTDDHVRVARNGRNFDVYTGTGGAWTLRGQVVIQAENELEIAKVGLYVNSSAGSTGFTAQFDWFEHISGDPQGWLGEQDD